MAMKSSLPKLGLLFLLFSSVSLIFSSSVGHGKVIVGSETLTLYAIADSYVDSSSPGSNYGTSKSLIVNFDSYDCYAYIMFDLSSIPSNVIIISAELRLYAFSGYWKGPWGVASIGAYYCDSISWSELEINWSNKPSFNTTPTDTHSFGMFEPVGWKGWNITVDIKRALGYGKLTEVLKWSSGTYGHMEFDSRETSTKPELRVEYSIKPIYEVVLESLQNTGMTSNLGLITLAGYTFSPPTNASIVDGSYWVAYEGGYKFVRWETTGGITVSNAYALNTTVTFSGPGTLRAVGSAETVQYLYDDGTREGSTFEEAGEMVAMRFSPFFSGKLEAVLFYIDYLSYDPSKNSFKVHVMDSDRKDLITPILQTPSGKGWFEADLSSYNIPVSSGCDFYIAVEWMNDWYPELGIDRSTPDGRSWSWNGTTWKTETYYDYMIRATVALEPPGTRVTIDKSLVIDERADVGSVQTVGFHAVWDDGRDLKEGILYVNGQGYATDSTGWMKFNATSSSIGKSVWAVTGVKTADGVDRSYGQTAPNPSIIWDKVLITLSCEERVLVENEAPITWIGKYAYDNSPFTGRLTLNETVKKSTIGRYGYSVKGIEGCKYGLTAFSSNSIAVIFDRIKVRYQMETMTPGSLTITVEPRFEFDNKLVEDAGVKIDNVVATHDLGKPYQVTLTNWNPTIAFKISIERGGFGTMVIEATGLAIGNVALYSIMAAIVIIAVIAMLRRRGKEPATPTAPTVPHPPPPIVPPKPPTAPPPEEKYCIHCGTLMPVDAVYCPKCGKKRIEEIKAP